MELTKVNLLDKISEQYKPYILAFQTPDLRSQKRSENLNQIYKSIVFAMELTGSKVGEQKDIIMKISENFYNEICVKYPYAKHGEITLAFKKGALKEYGEYFGFNVQTLWVWWKKYLESTELKGAKVELNRAQDEIGITTSKPLMIGETRFISVQSILNAFNEYKLNGNMPVYARVYYMDICSKKGIKTLIEDEAIRVKIRKEAKEGYERDLRAKKYHINEPANFLILMNSFDSQNKTYLAWSQKLALKYYWDSIDKLEL